METVNLHDQGVLQEVPPALEGIHDRHRLSVVSLVVALRVGDVGGPEDYKVILAVIFLLRQDASRGIEPGADLPVWVEVREQRSFCELALDLFERFSDCIRKNKVVCPEMLTLLITIWFLRPFSHRPSPCELFGLIRGRECVEIHR